MTITDPINTDTIEAGDSAELEPLLCWLNLADMAPHPDNPRHPVPWYASTKAATYGDEGWSNFVNAAFLWESALAWPAHRPLPFRFRIVVHDGRWDVARCAAEWVRYTDG